MLGIFKRALHTLFLLKKSKAEDEEEISLYDQPILQAKIDTKDLIDEEDIQGLTPVQKGLLSFVWMVSIIYSLISNVILTKERDVQCSVRSDLTTKFDIVSLFVAIGIPVVCLCMWPIAHIVLTACSCLISLIIRNSSRGRRNQPVHYEDNTGDWREVVIVICFSIIFILIYPTQMYIAEMYFANIKTIFSYMLIKYCVGSFQLLMSPLCLIVIKSDIRRGAKASYMKKSTQNDDRELTYEEIQEHLGIGVQVNT